MFYDFDVQKFGWQMLPPILRGKVMRALLHALLLPLVGLIAQLRALRTESRERLASSGQVSSLVETLRRAYQLQAGDVYLEEGAHKERYLYLGEEKQPSLYLPRTGDAATPPALLYEDEGSIEPDYYIHVPEFLQREEEGLLRLIEQNRPAGRKYKLIYDDYE